MQINKVKSNINLNGRGNEKNIFEFPSSEEIIINKSNLQIQLSNFKDAIKNSFSLFDLISIIALWSPIVSADFKGFYGINQDMVKGGYITLAIIITIYYIWTKIIANIGQKNVSSDPEKMSEKILNQCQKRK